MDYRKATLESLQKELATLEAEASVNQKEIERISSELGIEPKEEVIKGKIEELTKLKEEKSKELDELISELESLDIASNSDSFKNELRQESKSEKVEYDDYDEFK